MNNNGKEKTRLTVEDAFEKISEYSLGILGSGWTKAISGRARFTFDTINFEDEHLVFGQLNGTDIISFPVIDITNEIFISEIESTDQTVVEFHLVNGERWIASSFGYKSIAKMDENYSEVDIDFVLKKLSNCSHVCISYSRSEISFDTSYDIVEIEDTIEDFEWDGEREVAIIFKNSCSIKTSCVMNICDYGTKFYVVKEFAGFISLNVGLHDTPFADICMTILDSTEFE